VPPVIEQSVLFVAVTTLALVEAAVLSIVAGLSSTRCTLLLPVRDIAPLRLYVPSLMNILPPTAIAALITVRGLVLLLISAAPFRA
jgi:hypothetical protein